MLRQSCAKPHADQSPFALPKKAGDEGARVLPLDDGQRADTNRGSPPPSQPSRRKAQRRGRTPAVSPRRPRCLGRSTQRLCRRTQALATGRRRRADPARGRATGPWGSQTELWPCRESGAVRLWATVARRRCATRSRAFFSLETTSGASPSSFVQGSSPPRPRRLAVAALRQLLSQFPARMPSARRLSKATPRRR